MKPLIYTSILIGVVTTMLFFQTLSPALSSSDRTQPNKIERSPQYASGRFKPEARTLDMSPVTFVSTTWDFIFGGKNRTPDAELPVQPVDLSHFNQSADRQLNATWLGHSSLMINIDGYKILTDPVFEKSVSLVGPTRFNGEVPLDISQVPPIDAVIISHNHYDHLNRFSIEHLHAKAKKFIVPLGVGAQLQKWGVPDSKIVELDWWEEFHIDARLMVAATPAQHFSGRGLTDRNKTLWASWVIKTPVHRLFFSGDSGYFSGFKKIGAKYGPFDITFIECGAYNKSWARVHMFPEQTVQAHLDLKGDLLHPIHWGTFNLALHPWYEPMERLTACAAENNIVAATPIVGETTVFNTSIPVVRWWQPAMGQPEHVRMTSGNPVVNKIPG